MNGATPAGGPVRGLSTPAHVLVTGASAGIGLAVATQLLAQDGVAHVHALSRKAGQAPALAALRERHGDARLSCVSADLTCDNDLAALAGRIGARSAQLHLVFNAAGVLHGAGLQPEKSLSAVERAALARSFDLNAFAPILLAKALVPLLPRDEPAVLASLSARVGSITDNRLGGWYAYRASKAAQNQLWRTLAIELRRSHPRACCVSLHPGTVDTALSQPFQARVPADKLFSPERAARQLLAVVAGLGAEDSGRFIAWDGRDIPW